MSAVHHINLHSAPHLRIVRTDQPDRAQSCYTAACLECGRQVYQVITDTVTRWRLSPFGIEAFIQEHARCQRFAFDHLPEGSY